MIASLGMYDRPEIAGANDRYWVLIRDRLRSDGIATPDALTRGEAAYWPAWQSPDLVLSQTCGLPFRACLHGQVALVGTPDFGIEGCQPGYYRSLFIARADDPRTGVNAFADADFAFNDGMSHSGWAAPVLHMASLGLSLRPVMQSGGHGLSAQTVAEGRADWAAIDAVTWRLIARYQPALASRLRIIGATSPSPGLPYITAPRHDAGAMRAAIASAIPALSSDDREALGLRGIVAIPAAEYLAIPTPPPPEAGQSDQFAQAE